MSRDSLRTLRNEDLGSLVTSARGDLPTAELAKRLSIAARSRRYYSDEWVREVEAGARPLYPRDQRVLAVVLGVKLSEWYAELGLAPTSHSARNDAAAAPAGTAA